MRSRLIENRGAEAALAIGNRGAEAALAIGNRGAEAALAIGNRGAEAALAKSALVHGKPRRLALVGLAVGVALGVSGPVAGDVVPEDGVPAQLVAFFATGTSSCPPGWETSAEAAGRLVVGVEQAEEVGVQVGAPLTDQEDRKHQHAFAASVDLPYKSVSAANGGNQDGARAGMQQWSGQTVPATTGLPFIQLPVCEKR